MCEQRKTDRHQKGRERNVECRVFSSVPCRKLTLMEKKIKIVCDKIHKETYSEENKS